jgi:hypothetical protein
MFIGQTWSLHSTCFFHCSIVPAKKSPHMTSPTPQNLKTPAFTSLEQIPNSPLPPPPPLYRGQSRTSTVTSLRRREGPTNNGQSQGKNLKGFKVGMEDDRNLSEGWDGKMTKTEE